ncbi:MAG: phosphotransferase [Akkermansia sp.]|nr:phosphotransferase [Akkermansia sp.]
MSIPPDGALHIAALCREHGLQVDVADLQLIVAGASGRVIMRVCPGGEPCGIIGVYWTAARADNGSFVDAARGLAAHGVRVPQILRYRDAGQGCGTCLVQDMGSADLLGLKNAPWAQLYPAYCSAIQAVHALHSLTPDWPLQPEFDATMYRWEQGYFAEHFLGRHCGLSARDFMELPATQQTADYLAGLPRVPVHRDFQSQNIMLQGEVAYLIDFQGMRYGRAEYDLASLVYDPYMELTAQQSDVLIAAYAQITGSAVQQPIFYACALQRLMQALGAYANIGYNQQRDWYLNMIPAGVAALRHVATRTPVESPAYPLSQWLLNHV